MENSKFIEIGLLYQNTLESNVVNYPSGTCYLAGYCLAEYFKKIGFDSKSVTGSLALIDKNGKYIVYGNLNIPKSNRIGVYHTWCEILIDEEWHVLDPSLKYNKVTLKSFGAKLNPKIPDILFTKDKNTFVWKYVDNENLVKESDFHLDKATNQLKKGIIQTLIESSNI
jgi:hypothetical protein